MGVKSIDSLYELSTNPDATLPDFQGTNIIEHLVIPLKLPDLQVDENHLGKLKYIGFGLFGTVTITGIGLCTWTYLNQNIRVVKVAQPIFLYMVAFGCILLSSAMIPWSLEDFNVEGDYRICMAKPWLLCLGFNVIFGALTAKTWRVNYLVQQYTVNATRGYRKRKAIMTIHEVLRPFILLLVSNVIVLVFWTVNNPLRYVRVDSIGTDAWNRVIATYGQCRYGGDDRSMSFPYWILLGLLNVGTLFFANYQAYRARNITSDYSESTYIGIAMASLLQAALIGSPVMVLVQDSPLAFYLTSCFVYFIVSFGILCLIFIPKVENARRVNQRKDATNESGTSSNAKLRFQPQEQALPQQQGQQTAKKSFKHSIMSDLESPPQSVSELPPPIQLNSHSSSMGGEHDEGLKVNERESDPPTPQEETSCGLPEKCQSTMAMARNLSPAVAAHKIQNRIILVGNGDLDSWADMVTVSICDQPKMAKDTRRCTKAPYRIPAVSATPTTKSQVGCASMLTNSKSSTSTATA